MRLFVLIAALVLSACSAAPADPPPPEPPLPPISGNTCGGIAGLKCPHEASGQFCQYQPGQMCGAADQMGSCVSSLVRCTREYRPVCGCDGETYANSCVATSRKVSIAHHGACEDDEAR